MLRILITAVLVLLASVATAKRRVALVIGEGVPRARQRGDAQSIEATLQRLAFEVRLETSGDRRRNATASSSFAYEAGADPGANLGRALEIALDMGQDHSCAFRQRHSGLDARQAVKGAKPCEISGFVPNMCSQSLENRA